MSQSITAWHTYFPFHGNNLVNTYTPPLLTPPSLPHLVSCTNPCLTCSLHHYLLANFTQRPTLDTLILHGCWGGAVSNAVVRYLAASHWPGIASWPWRAPETHLTPFQWRLNKWVCTVTFNKGNSGVLHDSPAVSHDLKDGETEMSTEETHRTVYLNPCTHTFTIIHQ